MSDYINVNKKTMANYTADNFKAANKNPKKTKGTEFVDDIVTRVPFDRSDYDRFRPNEAIPTKFKDLVSACRVVYRRTGIVRNVIDLMTDFVCEDMRIKHEDKNIESFFKVWMKKVALQEAANEFARHFLLDSNVVIKRVTAKLSKPKIRQMQEKIFASPDLNLKKDKKTMEKNEVPWRYIFLNILGLEWDRTDLSAFGIEKQLLMTIPQELKSLVYDKSDVIKTLPKDIKKAIEDKKQYVELDMSKIFVSHNKKDSWDVWAPPYLEAVLSDILYKEKLQQAEVSALDGVINVVRLWKLGDHENGILPDEGAINKLVNILEANTGGGTIDLAWDSMIDVEALYPPVDKILGSEKYVQVNKDILIGLGVPEVLIGGGGGNFSNSWIQLKTLVEKLEYVRQKLIEWIETEIRLVTETMGFKTLPIVRFAHTNLQDENVTKRLIVGLLDRGVISVEAVLDSFGEDFIIEMNRIKSENKVMDEMGIEFKGPFNNDITEDNETGSDAPTNKDKTGEHKAPSHEGGRPPDQKDTDRDERTPKPLTANNDIFAFDALDSIDKHIVPLKMKDFNVKNARQLTSQQRVEIDNTRLIVLSCITNSETSLTKDSLIEIARYCDKNLNNDFITAVRQNIQAFIVHHKEEPTVLQRKRIEAVTWAKFFNSI